VGNNNYTKHVEVNNNIIWHAGSTPATSTHKGTKMDYQNKKKFKKAQKKKIAKQAKVRSRRAEAQEESRVDRLLAKIRYDSRDRIRPYKKEKS
jgi:hypothetical protein